MNFNCFLCKTTLVDSLKGFDLVKKINTIKFNLFAYFNAQ